MSETESQGHDDAFAADEAAKSNLILSARLLSAQGQEEEAASRFAQAASMEENLSERCLNAGQRTKAWVHRFSAASCWAQAGNFYQAIAWCNDLLAQADLPATLRAQVERYARTLRFRRGQWYAELTLQTSAPAE